MLATIDPAGWPVNSCILHIANAYNSSLQRAYHENPFGLTTFPETPIAGEEIGEGP